MHARRSLPVLTFGGLALVMALTRVHHFAAIPDASWAVFFVAGFLLHRQARWAFPLLMAVAVAADGFAISRAGLEFWQHYCVSPAYWFLIPSYGLLWLGGLWLARHDAGLRWSTLGHATGALVIAEGLCYLLSNGSFYWLSDSWGGEGATRTLAGWGKNLADWYLPFLKTTAMYVAIGALIHAGIQWARRGAVPPHPAA